MLSLTMLQKWLENRILWIDRSQQNKAKIKQKKSTHRFLGIATYNICSKCQGKIVTLILVGGSGSFRFLSKRHGSW